MTRVLAATTARQPAPVWVATSEAPDVVGAVDGRPQVAQPAVDTLWIADWTFDGGGGSCTDTGWIKSDNRIHNDGVIYWHLEDGFSTTTGMAGNSMAVGYHDNACCQGADGYDNDWYQAIRYAYSGSATLSLDFIVDSEPGFDFLQIETDSLCQSFERVNDPTIPDRSAASFRTVEESASGLVQNGEFVGVSLTDYGDGTHCVYVSFFADGGFSPCDGEYPTAVGEAAVVDNIVITGGTPASDTFEAGDPVDGGLLNIQESQPFGLWARLYRHIPDTDVCTENSTCAWLFSDHTTPTIVPDPCTICTIIGLHPGLDNSIISPWVSLAGTPGYATVLSFRRFGGNRDRFVQHTAVRGRSPLPGACVSPWGQVHSWQSLHEFRWRTFVHDMTAAFDPQSAAIQVRFRVADWDWITGSPSASLPGLDSFVTHSGPYLDRVRIGRLQFDAPLFVADDGRSRAQDAFPTEIDPTFPPGTGEHHRPSRTVFGTSALSQGADLGAGTSPNLITGDSITVTVRDVRGAGGIATVQFHAAIVGGPHVGKSPPPWPVGPNGFFVVPASNARRADGQIVADVYFVDLDDDYFRGGDELHYFWLAADAQGGSSSFPSGLMQPPGSIAEAEATTGGMFQVTFLPSIAWDPGYLLRISQDPHGKLDPSPDELAASEQRACLLYSQQVNARRRSGSANRTSFMWTLDRLGYSGSYDVYDHSGLGNTNNHLGGRATVELARGYGVIVYDAGNADPSGLIMPDGSDTNGEKIDQAGWFRSWLSQAVLGGPGVGTLWVIAANALQEAPDAALYRADMGVTLLTADQSLNVSPDVDGIASFVFDRGGSSASVDFSADFYSLSGGCPDLRHFDGLGASGAAVVTHRYRAPNGPLGAGAIVMNTNTSQHWNTILQSHAWFDIRDARSTVVQPQPEVQLLQSILTETMPAQCPAGVPVGTEEGNEAAALPRQTRLFQNVPNPFNPMTVIHFDLAQSGWVSLRIYDVAGRLVRPLVEASMTAGLGHRVGWDGLDQAGRRVPSGIYLYRLTTAGTTATRKMMLVQ